MNCGLIFSQTAKEDLRSIAYAIFELTGSSRIAAEYIAGIKETCDVLKDFPESGSLPRDRVLMAMGYRFTQYKDYLIFYLTDGAAKTVTIMAVFNGTLDYMRHMRKYL